MRIAAALALITAVSCASLAEAAPAKAPARQCFLARNIDGFTPVDPVTVNLRVNVADFYQLKLFSDCRDIDWSLSIGLEQRGSNWICDGDDARLIVPAPGGPRRCLVTSVRRMSKEEVKALPPKQRP